MERKLPEWCNLQMSNHLKIIALALVVAVILTVIVNLHHPEEVSKILIGEGATFHHIDENHPLPVQVQCCGGSGGGGGGAGTIGVLIGGSGGQWQSCDGYNNCWSNNNVVVEEYEDNNQDDESDSEPSIKR